MSIAKINNWLRVNKENSKLKIKKIDFNKSIQWKFNNKKISHIKKSFFYIQAFKFKKERTSWFQPLIIQNESGILGIVKKKSKNIDYYLLQAKNEPGNIKGLQISPTVQATKSNYLRKHGGKKTEYLNFFKKKNKKNKVLSKSFISEQGTRFLEKFNYNILIETKKNIYRRNNFYWFTKKDLKKALNKKNLLNMDTISVLSSIIKKNRFDSPLNSFNSIKKKLNFFKKKYKISKKKIDFRSLKGWKIDKNKIYDLKKKFFSVIFLEVKALKREVRNWDQPIISDFKKSINCIITCYIKNTSHYLLKIALEPGLKTPRFTATICERNFAINSKKLPFMKYVTKKNSKLDIIYSDEGGRFYKNETRNIISLIPNYKISFSNIKYVWVSHNQMIELIKKNLVSIEARNLFGSYNIDKIK